MKTKSFILFIFFFCTLAISAQVQRVNLLFNPGQTTLNEIQKEEIKKISQKYNRMVRVSIYPLVYDSFRNQMRFDAKAQLQARAIKEYAVKLGYIFEGIPQNFPCSYMGWSICVSLRVVPTPKAEEPSPNEYLAIENPLSELFDKKPSQYFTIDPLKDTILIGAEGTRIVLKANCLLAKEAVQIELVEFYSLADYVKNALPSTSNGNFLQTGGTIFIEATEKSNPAKKVEVNKTIGVGLDFTIGKTDPNMSIFVKDPRYPAQLNWIKAGYSKPRMVTRESWQITETTIDAEGNVIGEKTFNSKEEWEKYKKGQAAITAKKQADVETKQASKKLMESKLQIYDLGLINCDKFSGEPMTPFTFIADTMTAQYYLVYTDVRGVMHGHTSGTAVRFSSIPANKKATLIAISYSNNQAYLYKTVLNPSEKKYPNVKLVPVSESKINQELALLK